MKKVGMRTIKTAVAILIVCLINLIFCIINQDLSDMWYSPFFAAIGAAFSIHPKREDSVRMAKIRSVGTLFGGIMGMVLVVVHNFSFDFIKRFITVNEHLDLFIYYLIISFFVVVIINVTVKLKQTDAVFVCVMTYCSVSIGVYEQSHVVFAFNRMGSTLIGIGIALCVNLIHLPHFNKSTNMFIVQLEDFTDIDTLNTYERYKLNYLLTNKMDLVFNTYYNEVILNDILEGMSLPNPTIMYNGVCMYDTNKKEYINVHNFSLSDKFLIKDILKDLDVNGFEYFICSNKRLNIFINKVDECEQRYIDSKNKKCYISGNSLEDSLVCKFEILDTKENIESVISKLDSLNSTSISYTITGMFEDHIILEIKSSLASVESQTKVLNENNVSVVRGINNILDLHYEFFKK